MYHSNILELVNGLHSFFFLFLVKKGYYFLLYIIYIYTFNIY